MSGDGDMCSLNKRATLLATSDHQGGVARYCLTWTMHGWQQWRRRWSSLCAWTLAEHDKGGVPIGGVWKRQYMRSCDSLTTLRTCEVDYLAGAYFPVFLA